MNINDFYTLRQQWVREFQVTRDNMDIDQESKQPYLEILNIGLIQIDQILEDLERFKNTISKLKQLQ